ncbi:MAG: ATP synthase F1 subunit delta [Lachnospiraceae bacterium]|nr:ATP synthase F1 subunit delta [Lachnospiraceae bacterium]
MTQEAINNGQVLLSLNCYREAVEQFQDILNCTDLLLEVLSSPVVSEKQKRNIIKKIFAKSDVPDCLVRFLYVMCKNGMMNEINDIFESYYQQWDQEQKILRVSTTFASEPSKKEIQEIHSFIEAKYPDWEHTYEYNIDPQLLGGYKIRYGNVEYDKSYQNRLSNLERVIGS